MTSTKRFLTNQIKNPNYEEGKKTMGKKRQKFKIAIGDWSGDGHGHCDYYLVSALGSIDDVREAFFKAREVVPKELHPEQICSEYEETRVSPEVARRLVDFYDLSNSELYNYEEEWFEKYFFTEGLVTEAQLFPVIVLLFIMKGNPDLDLRLEEENYVPTLHFYGSDDKGRHINFMGYGIKTW